MPPLSDIVEAGSVLRFAALSQLVARHLALNQGGVPVPVPRVQAAVTSVKRSAAYTAKASEHAEWRKNRKNRTTKTCGGRADGF